MRRLLYSALAAGAMTLILALPALAQDRNCDDFATQADAQAYFVANGGSAANNFDGLDRDRDGFACEDRPGGVGEAVAAGAVPNGAVAPDPDTTPATTLITAGFLVLIGAGVALKQRRSLA